MALVIQSHRKIEPKQKCAKKVLPVLIICLVNILLIAGFWSYRYCMEQRRFQDCAANAMHAEAIWDVADSIAAYESASENYTEYWFGGGNYMIIHHDADIVVRYHADRDYYAQYDNGQLTFLMIGYVENGKHQYKSYRY